MIEFILYIMAIFFICDIVLVIGLLLWMAFSTTTDNIKQYYKNKTRLEREFK